MTLPLSGPLGFGDINQELDLSIAEQLGLGEALARSLASTSSNPPPSTDQGTIIGVGNFYGAVNGIVAGYLIVGGGGGGDLGGGGGGGVLSGINVLKPGKSYSVIVGAGAPAGRSTGGSSSIDFGGSAPIPLIELTYLVVAGGGGGGADTNFGTQAGGGGGGGVLTGKLLIQSGTEYSIIVGSGGSGGTTSSGQSGRNSSFGSIIALGGGAGAGRDGGAGSQGGSGGAGIVGSPGGQGFPGQGFSGGSGNGGDGGGGGGGGAGEPGGTINGGNGILVSIGGISEYYGGGGGGRSGIPPYTEGTGGLGGGVNFSSGPARPNTGGGGGGGGGTGGFNGGSGVVKISYKSPVPLLEGGQITVNLVGVDTYQIHTFTATGTLKFNAPPSINKVIALGGGGGGAGDATGPGLNGSSGGGGGAGSTSSPPSTNTGGSGTAGQGNAGGGGFYAGVPFAMGGGGGAGSAGQDGSTSDSNGGDGVSSSITGTAVIYGGGGGGYRRGTFADISKGLGVDGGGNGSVENPVGTLLRGGTQGTNGLGGGGGGGSTNISLIGDSILYPRSDGRWAGFMNTYAVWPTTGAEVASYSIYRYFTAPYSGTYYFRSAVDNGGAIYVDDSLIGGTVNFNQNPSPVARVLTAGSHLLRFDVSNAGDVAGIAVTVSNSSDQVIWDTRTFAVVLYSSGSAGGNGTVIVSYLALVPQLTGGTITSYVNGSNNTVQVHTFTSSDTLTFPIPSITWGVPEGSLETVPQGANVTTVNLNATSSVGNPVTYTLNGLLPSGLSFDDVTGVISGKTDNNVTRTIWNFSVTATDSVRGEVTSTREFSYNISNPVYTTALITDAGFQDDCTSVNNRTTELQEVCNGQFTCTFNPSSWGDPFPGVVKQFVVTMSCTNGTGVYDNDCLGGGIDAGINWTFTCTAL